MDLLMPDTTYQGGYPNDTSPAQPGPRAPRRPMPSCEQNGGGEAHIWQRALRGQEERRGSAS
jgi:hypothetical protein